MTDTIIRAQHGETEAFFIKARKTSQDTTISYEASGLLDYLLSKPNDWKVQPSDLTREGCGRDKVYRILNELISAGYIHRKELRKDDGTILKYIYVVHERPQPLPENPDTAQPDTAQPDTAKPDITEYRDTQNTDQTKNRQQQTTDPTPATLVVVEKLKSIGIIKSVAEELALRCTLDQVDRLHRYANANNLKNGWIVKMIRNGEDLPTAHTSPDILSGKYADFINS